MKVSPERYLFVIADLIRNDGGKVYSMEDKHLKVR